jgi:hypothetical protein
MAVHRSSRVSTDSQNESITPTPKMKKKINCEHVVNKHMTFRIDFQHFNFVFSIDIKNNNSFSGKKNKGHANSLLIISPFKLFYFGCWMFNRERDIESKPGTGNA